MDREYPAQPPPSRARDTEIDLRVYRRPGEPEHYRLSAARLAGRLYLGRPLPPPQPIVSSAFHPPRLFATNRMLGNWQHFWFRTRCVSAMASRLSDLHPHVLGLQLRPSAVATLIASAVRFLPARVQVWARATFPEWFLPDNAVLKIRKPGQEEEILNEYFDAELKAYRLMKLIRGLIVPKFFGLVRYNGQRAMKLEHLRGVSMSSPEGAKMRLEELAALLLPCYRALYPFRVQYEDSNLSNFVLVDGRIMVLDLESAVFDSSDRDLVASTKLEIEELAERYTSMQAYYRHEGSLEGA